MARALAADTEDIVHDVVGDPSGTLRDLAGRRQAPRRFGYRRMGARAHRCTTLFRLLVERVDSVMGGVAQKASNASTRSAILSCDKVVYLVAA